MWIKPWTIKEGFLIGGGLFFAGLMLELCVGPVDWSAFRWPVNGFLFGGFLTLIVLFYLLRKKVYGLLFISTYKAAIPALVYAIALTIVMGLTRQTADGTWLNNMLGFWPFVLIYVYLAVILGLVVLRRPKSWATLSHLGLFLAMTTATLGNADVQRLKMLTVKDEPEWRALTPQQQIVELPIAIELKEFIMETYDDGSPKRFASDIEIMTKTGRNFRTNVEVNRPAEVEGWKIYQYGYDTEMGSKSSISILELVRDPWLPLVYTGIYMMLGGAVCMFLGFKKLRRG